MDEKTLTREQAISEFDFKVIPAPEQKPITSPDLVEFVEDPGDYNKAISRAQIYKKKYLDVSDTIMDALTGSTEIDSITYASPGIRVFRKGRRDELLARESMNAEAYLTWSSNNKVRGLA